MQAGRNFNPSQPSQGVKHPKLKKNKLKILKEKNNERGGDE